MAILSSAAASARSSPDRLTSASRAPWAAKWSWASCRSTSRRSASSAMHRAGEAGGGVEPGAGGGAAEGHLAHARQRGADALGRLADLGGVAAELLAEGDRGGVHQVGAPGLHHRGVGGGLLVEHPGQVVEGGQQVAATRTAAATWMAVGNTSLDDCDALTSSLGCTGSAERRRSRGGRSPRWRSCWWTCPSRSGTCRPGTASSQRPSATCCAAVDDGGGHVAVDHPEVGVDLRRGRLDRPEGVDQLRLDGPPRHGEVLHRPLRLGAPAGRGRHPHLAHRVVLDPDVVLGHAPTVRPRDVPSSRSTSPARSLEVPVPASRSLLLRLLVALAALTLLTAACGGDDSDDAKDDAAATDGSTDGDTDDDAVDDAPNPCELITLAEMEAAFGFAVERGRVRPADIAPIATCTWSDADPGMPAKVVTLSDRHRRRLRGQVQPVGQAGLRQHQGAAGGGRHPRGRPRPRRDSYRTAGGIYILDGATSYSIITIGGDEPTEAVGRAEGPMRQPSSGR